MTFDGHKPGDSQAGQPAPKGEHQAFNGPDLLSEHSTIVGKGDHRVAGNPKFEVADASTTPAPGSDATKHRADVASIVGGDPSRPDALQTSREQAFLAGQAQIASISTPEQGQALMGQLTAQTAEIQARIKALSAIQNQYA